MQKKCKDENGGWWVYYWVWQWLFSCFFLQAHRDQSSSLHHISLFVIIIHMWLLKMVLSFLSECSNRLLVMFLLSLISVLLVAVVGAHSRLAGLLLAACFGYTLSQDLSHFVRIFWSITCKRPRFKIPTLIWFHNKFATNWKVFVLISVLKGVVLLSLSSLLVYVTFMAKCSARVTASETVGGCVLALSVLLWLSATSQGIYVLGVLRNPLHPWNLKTVKKFKQHKVIPCFYGTPLRIILDYGKE